MEDRKTYTAIKSPPKSAMFQLSTIPPKPTKFNGLRSRTWQLLTTSVKMLRTKHKRTSSKCPSTRKAPDWFPLPKIGQLVDATASHARLSFLDAYRGYHQIAMDLDDVEKTTFITPYGIFCYRVMPFGLKNSGATFNRAIFTRHH
ncbi:uncharacterized protein LOC131330790 [Rhododendron vialii]|uniref:uncharacterized protein LOC131330790 n=1 Tax=Rhododendron vialii TaxID=182163 RepID=UPI00265E48A5|nr:uncharacterized protein LOC131330790 [Rhododendron vialii]